MRAALDTGLKWVRRLERISRPYRMPALVDGRAVAVERVKNTFHYRIE